jgi:hypothetical protein
MVTLLVRAECFVESAEKVVGVEGKRMTTASSLGIV